MIGRAPGRPNPSRSRPDRRAGEHRRQRRSGRQILHPHEEIAAGAAREQPGEQRGAQVPDMQIARRRRGISTGWHTGKTSAAQHDRCNDEIVDLPVNPPVAPMLAKAVAAVPPQPDDGDRWLYEPGMASGSCSSATATRLRWNRAGATSRGTSRDRRGGARRTTRQGRARRRDRRRTVFRRRPPARLGCAQPADPPGQVAYRHARRADTGHRHRIRCPRAGTRRPHE